MHRTPLFILPFCGFPASASITLPRTFFCLAWLCFCLPVHAGVGETWEWRNPLPQGSTIHALAESDGRLVAVGRAGTVLTTSDGMNWTARVSATRSFLQAVAASGSTVVAVGREGTIVSSTDGGLTWALRSSGEGEWHTVTHGGGVWVAGGFSGALFNGPGAVMTSPDGLTWTAGTIPDSAGSVFDCAVWTGTRFVLGGWNFTGPGTVLATSGNGLTWTPQAIGMWWVSGLAWTGSRVVAAGSAADGVSGGIFVSTDGLAWTDALTPGAAIPFHGVVWTGEQLFAWPSYSSNTAYTSPTGESWTPRVISVSPPFYYSYGAAAGSGTALVAGVGDGYMLSSPDSGATWNSVPSGVAGNCKALTRFAGRWVAAGTEGSLTSSADGATWTPASSGNISRLRAITWHDGLWIAGGREEFLPPGLPERRQYSLFSSTDGVTWTDRSFGSTEVFGYRQIYSIIRAGSQWVAAALNVVLTSPDGITWQDRPVGVENRGVAWNGSRLVVAGGIEDEDGNAQGWVHLSDDNGVTWTNQTLGSDFLRSVVWTGNQFVTAGDQGSIYTSPAGAPGTWTPRNSGTFMDLRCVTGDGAGLVAVGGNYSAGPAIVTSPDGITWTPRTAPTTQVLYSVVKAGASFAATGYDGVVLTSPDALTWTARQTNTTHELYAAAWDGRQLLVSGEGGAILASTGERAFIEWKSVVRRPGPDMAVRLTWPAVAGRVYDIESATTMAPPWLPLPGSPRTATGVEEFIDFTESGPAAALRRFFRVSERP